MWGEIKGAHSPYNSLTKDIYETHLNIIIKKNNFKIRFYYTDKHLEELTKGNVRC